MNILMSEQAIALHRSDIEQLTPVNWINLSSAPNAQGVYATDIAFITREVTGLSTKTHILPDLQRYYDILRASPNLVWIQAHSAGADRPIFDEMMARGVRVTTASGANAAPVAHTAVAAVLALGRQFPVQIAAQQRREYTPMTNHPRLHDLSGQMVLVLGLGAIGSLIAKYLEALNIKVIGITRSNFTELNHYLPVIDFLVLACPLNAQTKGLVSADLIGKMKRGSYLVNVARGEVCIEADVIVALQSGQLGSAFLDGFEIEPLPMESPLWTMPNVMLSSHTAGHFSGHNEQVFQIFLKNLERYLCSEPLVNEVKA
jgi:D-2-hydroxyacid dehydrogenase (NADP+)